MKPLLPLLLLFSWFSITALADGESPENPSSAPVEVESTAPPVTEFMNRGQKEWPEDTTVFLIPIRQAIMHPQLFLIRRGVERARQEKADAIVFLLDTPGGRVDIMKEIVNTIIDLDIPTYALVEDEAISAGAIIALSTDYIYMQERATIGDAMPVIAGPNGYQELGENEREKIESYMDALVRSIAQAKGRDEQMIRAMVRRSVEFKLEDGTVISPEGNILTLTNVEAAEPRPDGTPLLSEGTVEDLDNMLNRVGLGDAEQIELLTTWADDLALLITRISPLLMTLALVLAYMEIQSPGIGWAGAGALLLFLVVTFGHNVAGLAGMGDFVLIALGLGLLLVEVLILPGFGFAGISGICLLLWGIIQSMIYRYPGNPGKLPELDSFANLDMALTNVGLAVIGSCILSAFLLYHLGANGLLGKRLVLADSMPGSVADPERTRLNALIGRHGSCVTPLTPSGTIDIEGTEYDSVSDGGYISKGTAVTVQDVRNYRLIVSDYSNESETTV